MAKECGRGGVAVSNLDEALIAFVFLRFCSSESGQDSEEGTKFFLGCVDRITLKALFIDGGLLRGAGLKQLP